MLALFCLAPLSVVYNLSVSSLQWRAKSPGQGEPECVCVRHIKPALLITAMLHASRKEMSSWCEIFRYRSSYDGALKRVEKCLQSLVMAQHPSCSHRWRATYYQQEASWHLPHIFSPSVLLNNISLLHLISTSSSSSPLFPSFPSLTEEVFFEVSSLQVVHFLSHFF